MPFKDRIVQKLVDNFLYFGTVAAATSVTCLLIEKIDELFERVREIEFERFEESKSSQEHELKK